MGFSLGNFITVSYFKGLGQGRQATNFKVGNSRGSTRIAGLAGERDCDGARAVRGLSHRDLQLSAQRVERVG